MIRPGDKVILNSGGAVMTALNVTPLDDGSFMADCRWIDMFGDWWSQRLPCDCLEKIDHLLQPLCPYCNYPLLGDKCPVCGEKFHYVLE